TATPTATATASPTATATSTPAATATPAASIQPAARPGPAASAPQAARNQRGTAVRGSIVIARAGSRVHIDALAQPGGGTPVGPLAKPVAAGKLAYSISLNAKAKKALRKGKLALTLKITVTPSAGDAFSATLPVTLKR